MMLHQYKIKMKCNKYRDKAFKVNLRNTYLVYHLNLQDKIQIQCSWYSVFKLAPNTCPQHSTLNITKWYQILTTPANIFIYIYSITSRTMNAIPYEGDELKPCLPNRGKREGERSAQYCCIGEDVFVTQITRDIN